MKDKQKIEQIKKAVFTVMKSIKKNVGSGLEKLLFLFQDAVQELRFRIIKAKKNREQMRKTLSPEEFRHYQKKEILGVLPFFAAGLAVILLCVFLLAGLVRLIFSAGSSLFSPKEAETELFSETENVSHFEEKDITLGSTGCMLLHSPFIDSYPDENGVYDFSSVYQYITPYYSEPDFMTCEFEGALGGEELGYSGYPSFKSPDIIIKNIRDSGVDLQMLATNHIYDGWSFGFHRTMDVYEDENIAYTGIRKTDQSPRYYIADIDGISVGFVNYVYETTGVGTNLNGMLLEEEDWELVNAFDYDNLEEFYLEMENNIAAMKEKGAQFIIANLHWGTEYQLTESEIQREIAQKLCDMGVNTIIGGHPHCEQPIDVFQPSQGGENMFCIFSEGNALSNQRTYLMDEMPTGHTEDGAMVTLTLHQDTSGTVTLSDVELLPTWVYRYADVDGSKYFILPLDDVDNLEALTGIPDIRQEALASYERTMDVLGPGLKKAQSIFRHEASLSEEETKEENTDAHPAEIGI